MVPGLVSVSFRKLSPKDIFQLCEECDLKCIEWGGDIHAPAGDMHKAKEILAMSEASGIYTASYGSYFRLGSSDDEFKRNLDTAYELKAPVLRIWAGTEGSELCGEKKRDEWITQLERISSYAEKAGVIVAPEFHINTLTDSLVSLRYLLSALPTQQFYWQPRWDWSEEDRLTALKEIGSRLTYIHVFTWRIVNGTEIRLPLAQGEGMWKKVFASLDKDMPALMEFVQNDDPENLIRDAAVLHSWIADGILDEHNCAV